MKISLGRRLLLFWNPSTSHFTMSDFEDKLKEIFFKYDFYPLDWGINNPKDIKEGLYFHIIKIGEGKCGIVMSGLTLSDSSFDESNKRYCRRSYKTDCDILLGVTEIYHPDRSEVISLEQLREALSDVPLDGSCNEYLLDEDQSRLLTDLEDRFLTDHPEIFEPKAARINKLPRP